MGWVHGTDCAILVHADMVTVVDTQALKAIAALQRPGKPDLLKRIVALFTSEAPKATELMQQGLDKGDLKLVRNITHTMKTPSAYVGAHALSERCRDIERAARDQNFPACMALSDGIDELFDDSLAALLNPMSTAA